MMDKYSSYMKKYLIQEYEDEKKVKEALDLFKEEGKKLAIKLGVEIASDDVLLELYAEHRIYSGMGNEKMAIASLESFNKNIKLVLEAQKNKEVTNKDDKTKKKGMMIFNG